MNKILVTILLLLFADASFGQYTLQLSIKSAEEKTPLTGATCVITSINRTVVSDSTGIATFINVPAGKYRLLVSYVGMQEHHLDISVPLQTDEPLPIFLEESEEHGEEVIVTATRTTTSIKDVPTRVETISGEELDEKGNMKPGDIRMMLNESTGIQTQQTSATSYNSSIRIQGLDGRYTQLLRDGFPLYSGFSGGLSLMQIAPLDLKQVEVIKGSSSTLYGGGAIAGLVNLVSKTPGNDREISLMANGTSAKGLDLSAFYSQRIKAVGVTVFGSRNTGEPYDPAAIGLTAIPKFERYTINPKLFVYGKTTNANIGVSYVTENRTGGSIDYIKHGTPGYFEKNKTQRFTSQATLSQEINENTHLEIKTSYTTFNRLIAIPSYMFEGVQQSSYSEVNLHTKRSQSDWIAGVNLLTDDFNEKKHGTIALRNYHYNTIGGFLQQTWRPASSLSIETGIRGDYVKAFGIEVLPRISVMYKFTNSFTARLGGGLGYKTPTVFNEEAEKVQFQNILPINEAAAANERSVGGNLDFNYRIKIGDVGVAINQLFFYTRLNHPLILVTNASNKQEFKNAGGFIDTKGLETNLRFSYSELKLFIGYTYADVNTHYDGTKSWFPLTARHRLNNVLMYEKEDKLKVGLEAYYFSPQKLSDGAKGRAYWLAGMMAEKIWEHFSLFVNFENVTDTRQTKFDTIYKGSIDQPIFRDIYAPVDGFVVNGGIKIKL